MFKLLLFIPLVLILIYPVVFSADKKANLYIIKKIQDKNITSIWLDINQDGKVDRIESVIGEKVLSIKQDLDLKGRLNSSTEFFDYVSDVKPIEETKIDRNYDGKVDRIESVYRNNKLKILITTHRIDSQFSGTFDKKYSTQTDIVQKESSEPCTLDQPFNDQKISRLSSEVSNIQLNLENGFYNSDFGYRIHQSCLEKWGGQDFVNILKESMTKGTQCLQRLAQENTQANRTPNGALLNLQNLNQLLSRSPVTIACHQQNYDWSRVDAQASTSASDSISEHGINHPYISINPNNPENKARLEPKDRVELSKTLFHEQLHNLGIRHNEGIEYPYTCETCCLSENDQGNNEKERVDAACKVCGGNYNGPRDPNYLRDLVSWGRQESQESRVSRSVTNYQKEFPGDKDAMITFAESTNHSSNPVGLLIARQLRTRNNNLSPEQQARLNAIESESANRFRDPQVNRLAGIAANAYINRYLDNSPEKMLDEIDKNKADIRALINRAKNANRDDREILGSIRTEITRMLNDAWIDGYPNTETPTNIRAQNILKDLGII